MLAGRKQTAIVFFLDETFEELEYDATSTVLEAVEYLAGVIKLQSYQTFTLYECRKVIAAQLQTSVETARISYVLESHACGPVKSDSCDPPSDVWP